MEILATNVLPTITAGTKTFTDTALIGEIIGASVIIGMLIGFKLSLPLARKARYF